MTIRATLVVSGPLQAGVAAALTQFVYKNNGNITDFDQYVDVETEPRMFFARMEWELEGFQVPENEIIHALKADINGKYQLTLDLRIMDRPLKMAIMVTKQLPCFYGMLAKILSHEWNVEPTLVVSNRMDMEVDAKRFDLPFHHLPITPETREAQGEKALVLFEQNDIDVVVLAKYMQIIPPNVLSRWSGRMINIHHSMLPAFVGAKPYHQAREYGVKFIGATAHYVTEELDEGPIIMQNVKPITHRQTADELVNMGKSIETETLLRAVELHLQHRIVISGRRSIIFD
ncbi:formyltetrahydrofolate deformylase [Planctobacterium marinum]|uniref:formyltetrahydrofolate deformylase n=1 Tax=Planctobacterium marinum TaxID=1631968 RepID=UPI0030C6EA6B